MASSHFDVSCSITFLQVVIVLTDGIQTIPQGSTQTTTNILIEAVNPLKTRGIEVNTVGIGKKIDLVDLLMLATDDTKVYLAESFVTLGDLVTELKQGECPGKSYYYPNTLGTVGKKRSKNYVLVCFLFSIKFLASR